MPAAEKMAAARARRAKVLSEKGQPANLPQPIATGSSGPMGSILKALEKAPKKSPAPASTSVPPTTLSFPVPATPAPAPVEAPEIAAPLDADTPPDASTFQSPEPVELPEPERAEDVSKPRWLSRVIEGLTLALITLVTVAGFQLLSTKPATIAPNVFELTGNLIDPAFGPPFLVAIPEVVESYAERSRADRLQRLDDNSYPIAAAPRTVQDLPGQASPAAIAPLAVALPVLVASLPERAVKPLLSRPALDALPETGKTPLGLLRSATVFQPERLAPPPARDIQLVTRPAARSSATN